MSSNEHAISSAGGAAAGYRNGFIYILASSGVFLLAYTSMQFPIWSRQPVWPLGEVSRWCRLMDAKSHRGLQEHEPRDELAEKEWMSEWSPYTVAIIFSPCWAIILRNNNKKTKSKTAANNLASAI